MAEALGHTWRVLAQFEVTPDDAERLVAGDDHRPSEQVFAGEAPAPDDARPWLGLHNLIHDELVVVCMRCEAAWTREVARRPCVGDPDAYAADGTPLKGGEPMHPEGAITRPNVAASSAPRPGRNDPCPCGSGRKFKRCCGA